MTMMYKLGAAAALLVVVALGAYFYGVHKVTVEWEKDKTAWQVTYDAQVKETTRVQGEWDKTKEHEDEWKIKAEVAGNDAAAIARRLRKYQSACSSTMPQAPGSTANPDGPSGESANFERIDRVTERHFAGCARDAERVGMWQVFYSELRAVY
jgi:hypothetical protein